jgi:Fic family protein
VPVAYASVPDAMDALFDCLKEEPDARVRAVLGHYAFTFVHPYMDGNGRCGRFLMNLMLASGGYPWTIIPVDRRDDTYFPALEAASGKEDIGPFSEMIHDLVRLEPSPARKLAKGEELSNREKGNEALP